MTTVLRRSFILGRLSPNTGRARIGLRIKALLPCVSSWRISIVNSEGPRADPASTFREFCAPEADRRHSMHDSPDRCRSITLNGTPGWNDASCRWMRRLRFPRRCPCGAEQSRAEQSRVQPKPCGYIGASARAKPGKDEFGAPATLRLLPHTQPV